MSIIDPGVVTWSQVGALSAVLGAIGLSVGGFVLRVVSNLGKRVDAQSSLIQKNYDEMLRHYATQEMVTQVERRLTETVNQIGQDIRQLTGTIQQLFHEMLHPAR